MHNLLHPAGISATAAAPQSEMIDGIEFIGRSPPIRGLPWAGTERAVAPGHCENEGATVLQD
jgi:hypothetical protein